MKFRKYSNYLVLILIILCISGISFLLIRRLQLQNRIKVNKSEIAVSTVLYPSEIPTSTPVVPTSTPAPTLIPTPTYYPGAELITTKITYYGWADNTPAGTAIAFPHSSNGSTIHDNAGGTGSFDDPVTFATDQDMFSVGTKLYVPYLQKYIIMEDLCGGCSDSWSKSPQEYHIDIWMNSTDTFPDKLLACEHAFTRRRELIELNPPPNRPVNIQPIFDSVSGACYTP